MLNISRTRVACVRIVIAPLKSFLFCSATKVQTPRGTANCTFFPAKLCFALAANGRLWAAIR